MRKIKIIPFTEGNSSLIEEIPKGISLIKAPAFWERGITGKGVVIAVLDSGCQIDHPDLKGRIIGGLNFTDDYSGSPEFFDDNLNHGTHVSGIIAANRNQKGVVGVSPDASLLILKVISHDGTGTYNNLIRAVTFATDWQGPNKEKVRIITMSLGGLDPDPVLHQAIQRAVRHNILVVCASGNAGDNSITTKEVMYPGYYKEVVQVGAIQDNADLAYFSNTNDQIDLYAPGVNVLSTIPKSTYGILSGTSMAAPHVAGAAALLISEIEPIIGRKLTEKELFSELIKRSIITKQGLRLLSLS